jgi:transposase
MDTTQQTDPRHVLAAPADEQIAHAYEQITRAGEELARAEEQLSKLEHDAVPGSRRLFDRPAVRGLTGLLLAACIGVAAIAWQSSYGDAAKEMIARSAPQGVATSSPPPESPGLAAQPSPPAVQAAGAEIAPSQPALLAQTVPEDVAPTAAPPSPELTRVLESMARDLATLGQEIEQLKASQEQMARDNANTAEQLKASREQMARVLAKASEQNLRPKMSAPPPRPTATPTRRPPPTL